jgi:hypothetical protein
MFQRKKLRWPIALGIGLLTGMALSGFWPHAPVHAVSTDRVDTFAIATGPVDNEVEAVYFLDFLTGDLVALVLGKQPLTWSGVFRTNVSADLGIDPQKNPKYLMATGVVGLRLIGGSRQKPSNAVCYVAEVTSGKVAAYAIPWTSSMYSAGQPQSQRLAMVGVSHFRQATGAGPGIGSGAVMPKSKGRE